MPKNPGLPFPLKKGDRLMLLPTGFFTKVFILLPFNKN
jgi:hypothetical protein